MARSRGNRCVASPGSLRLRSNSIGFLLELGQAMAPLCSTRLGEPEAIDRQVCWKLHYRRRTARSESLRFSLGGYHP